MYLNNENSIQIEDIKSQLLNMLNFVKQKIDGIQSEQLKEKRKEKQV